MIEVRPGSPWAAHEPQQAWHQQAELCSKPLGQPQRLRWRRAQGFMDGRVNRVNRRDAMRNAKL